MQDRDRGRPGGERDEHGGGDVRAQHLRDAADGERVQREEGRRLLQVVAVSRDVQEPDGVPLREGVEQPVAEPDPGAKRRLRRTIVTAADVRHRARLAFA